MDTRRFVAILVLTLGILALVYKGFTYTKETHRSEFGPFHLQWDEKEHVDIPGWAGVIMVVAGAAMLAIPGPAERRA